MDVLKDLTCPVCLEFYTFPIILPCSHVLCKSPCAENIFQQDFIRCPVCRENSYVDGGMTSLPRVISLESIIDKVKVVLSHDNRDDTAPLPGFTGFEYEAETPSIIYDLKSISKLPTINRPIINRYLTNDQSKCGPTAQSVSPHYTDISTFSCCSQQSLDSKLTWLMDKTFSRNSAVYSPTQPNELKSHTSYSDKQSFLWSADDEIQSILFPDSQKSNSPNVHCTNLDHKASQRGYKNHDVDFHQMILDGTMGRPEFPSNKIISTNLITTSELTNSITRKSPVLESPSLKLPAFILDATEFDRLSDVEIKGSGDSLTVDRKSVIEPPELGRLIDNLVLQTEIDEQLENLSDIQRQLTEYQRIYNHHMSQLQAMLDKQRSSFNMECQLLSLNMDVMRSDLISSLGEDVKMSELYFYDVNRNTAIVPVDGIPELTKPMVNSWAVSPATVRSGPQPSAADEEKRLHHNRVLEAHCMEGQNHEIQLTNQNTGLKNVNFLTPLDAPNISPRKPIIDIQRSSRNCDTVVLALAPRDDVISHYEIKLASAEQKQLDIEETLLAQTEYPETDDVTRYVITDNVCRGTTYYFRVVAWRNGVRGPGSDIVQCRTLDSRPCLIPVPVIIEKSSHVTSTSVEVNCPCPLHVTAPDLTYTLMYRKEAVRGYNVWSGAAMQRQAVHRIRGLCPDTEYQVAVLVTTSHGECQLSEKLMLRTRK